MTVQIYPGLRVCHAWDFSNWWVITQIQGSRIWTSYLGIDAPIASYWDIGWRENVLTIRTKRRLRFP